MRQINYILAAGCAAVVYLAVAQLWDFNRLTRVADELERRYLQLSQAPVEIIHRAPVQALPPQDTTNAVELTRDANEPDRALSEKFSRVWSDPQYKQSRVRLAEAVVTRDYAEFLAACGREDSVKIRLAKLIAERDVLAEYIQRYVRFFGAEPQSERKELDAILGSLSKELSTDQTAYFNAYQQTLAVRKAFGQTFEHLIDLGVALTPEQSDYIIEIYKSELQANPTSDGPLSAALILRLARESILTDAQLTGILEVQRSRSAIAELKLISGSH